MRTISFIGANYVARALGYNGVEQWGVQDTATREGMTPQVFDDMARDVAAAGFAAIDVWTAHCHYQAHAEGDYAEQVKASCARHGLQTPSYAGGLSVQKAEDLDAPFKMMNRIGTPIFAGGIGGPLPEPELAAIVEDACQKYGVRWAFENHPQKTVEAIMSKIGGGQHANCGVALDTGWCGTQGLDALEAVKGVREKLFIVHLKDITAVGRHDTCALGEGIVPVEAVTRYLVESGWDGVFCIEHEPYDRDPMPEIVRSKERLQQWLA